MQQSKFSTKDQDNDASSGSSCATNYGNGGWWYSECHAGVVTAKFPDPNKKTLPARAQGVSVGYLTGFYTSLQSRRRNVNVTMTMTTTTTTAKNRTTNLMAMTATIATISLLIIQQKKERNLVLVVLQVDTIRLRIVFLN